MWHYYQPHLTIHVGLNEAVQSFELEKKANKHVYMRPDNDEQYAKDNCNGYPGPDVISTTLDVDRICTEFNDCKRKLLDPPFTLNHRKMLERFAPFDGHETNPSWEGVHSMDTKYIENKHNIILWKEQIPVQYVDVDLIVPQLLDSFRPDLTIHVGLNEAVSSFVLETRAKKKGYIIEDNAKQYPATYRNPSRGFDSIVTSLDVASICTEFNDYYSPGCELAAELSTNAGRYLCEYIYYTSLSMGRSPTLFVHVPLNKYTPKQIVQGLERILELCLNHLARNVNDKTSAK